MTAPTGAVLPACEGVAGVLAPPKALQAAYEALEAAGQAALSDHLHGGTPAEKLADLLTRMGYPISASSIRTYRRRLAAGSSVKVEQ